MSPNNQEPNAPPKKQEPNAMGRCVLPEDLMISIFTHLPVKPLLRFKSVCKPCLKSINDSKFIKSHYHQISSDPAKLGFITHSIHPSHGLDLRSLFRFESHDDMKVTNLYHPFPPRIFAGKKFVGCCNGLICIADPPVGQGNIQIWNPAMKLHKFLQRPEPIPEDSYASLGFGYDEEGDDFKVVRIACLKGTMEVNVIVYSSKFDSWINIHVDLLFRVMHSVNNAIVGGAPHWVAKDLSDQSQIVWVDFKEMVCKMVPSNLEFARTQPNLMFTWEPRLMEWKDSVATIQRNKREGHEFVKVVAFDKNAKVWNTVHIIGPIELELYSFFKCLNSGKIIGGDFDNKLHVFDPESGGVKVLEMGETGHPQMIILDVYEYNESLFFIEGMEPLEKKKEQVEEKKEADEVDPAADPDEAVEEKKEPEEE